MPGGTMGIESAKRCADAPGLWNFRRLDRLSFKRHIVLTIAAPLSDQARAGGTRFPSRLKPHVFLLLLAFAAAAEAGEWPWSDPSLPPVRRDQPS